MLAFKIVEELPKIGEESTVYLIRNGAEEGDDLYLEYIYIDNRYELLGTSTPADNGVLQSIL